MPLVRIAQLHDTGCAVACVATVAGVSYTKAALHVKGRRHGNLAAYWSEMQRGLRALGFRCRMGTDFRAKGLPAILMFEWASSPGDFHCVVWDPEVRLFIDPAHVRSLGPEFYLERWRKNGRESLVVTGRR